MPSSVRRAAWLLVLAWAFVLPVHAEDGPGWRELSPAQREALQPLEREWPTIDAARKQKWLEIAGRLPSMGAEERARVQERMSDWARLTPAQRGAARLNYQQARELPDADRRASWEAYQALSPEQRRALAARAVPQPPGRGPAPGGREAARHDAASAAPAPRPVGPAVVQTRPGASTSLLSERREPPPYQQAGLPKINAAPGFVDRSTLLPQRGPQGAAVVPPPKAPDRSPPRRDRERNRE